MKTNEENQRILEEWADENQIEFRVDTRLDSLSYTVQALTKKDFYTLISLARQKERERVKDVFFHIAYSVKSCRAGDGDNRTWEEAACDCEIMAEKELEEIESLAEGETPPKEREG